MNMFPVSLIMRFEIVLIELRFYLPLCIAVNLGLSRGRSLIEGVLEECWREYLNLRQRQETTD
jgi:hypothetical protein